MIRFCQKCTVFVQPKLDYRHDEVCPACEEHTIFTLRQRHLFLDHFQAKLANGGYSATVRDCMFSRGGQSGTVVGVWEYGPHIDFFGPAPSIEAYEWDEVEVADYLEKDRPELELDRIVVPTLRDLQIGDWIMLRTGKTYTMNRRVKTRDHSKKLVLAGMNFPQKSTISKGNMYTIVDWLPKAEMEARTAQMKGTHAVSNR